MVEALHNEGFFGLIPAWLNFYDENYMPSKAEKEYVCRQTTLSETPVILPILLCPDDFDFSCTVVVVEVICKDNTVIWKRFGVDVTPFNNEDKNLPNYIGEKVNWFDGLSSFKFEKSAYVECVSHFAEESGISI